MRFFFTIAGYVANGLPVYIIGPVTSERCIIQDARLECVRGGRSLAEIAGIDSVPITIMGVDGDMQMLARDFYPGEELAAALKKLNEKTRVYEVFDCDNPLDTERFLAAAESLGLGFEAHTLANSAGSLERRRWKYEQ